MKPKNLTLLFASFALFALDILRLRATAHTPEALVWGPLALASVGLMLASARPLMPRGGAR